MNINESPQNDRKLILLNYTNVWRIGTGLSATLPPGEYRITGRFLAGDHENIVLDEKFYLSEKAFQDLTVELR